MFFIIGISRKEKRLDFKQLTICKCCSKYGQIEVFMVYSYLMLFFIPIIKWDKHYYAKMNCCGSICELNTELGKNIEKGEVTSLDINSLNFCDREHSVKYCSNCGFTTKEDYQFCPKCGKSF